MARPKSFDPTKVAQQIMMVFWAKGYEGANISDLEAATGLNKRSLYNEFGDKEAMFSVALNLYLSMAGEMGSLLAMEPLGVKNISNFFKAMKYEPGMLGCLLTKTVNEQDAPTDSVELAKEAILATEALLEKNLLADGYSKAKARALSAFLTSVIQGTTTMSRVDPDPKRLKAVINHAMSQIHIESPQK